MKDEFSLEAKFYDKIWGKHDYDSDVKFLNDLFHKHRCRSIIDVGCGTGNHSIRMNRLGYKVTGIDISQAMLKIARKKAAKAKIEFIHGDMRKLGKAIQRKQRFDAAICLGQVVSSLMTNRDVRALLNGLRRIIRKNGLFVFCARNAKKINEEYLNKLRFDHMVNEEKLQLLVLTYNTRDAQDSNIIIWRPIYFIKENNKVDFQMREHRLRWFEFSSLKKLLIENGFKIIATYSGPKKEKFRKDEHLDMWFITTTK